MVDMSEYKNKKVKIDLDNGFYYSGLVLTLGEDYISIRDKNDKLVFVNIKNIVSIREVGE
jgi:hypothetical protein